MPPAHRLWRPSEALSHTTFFLMQTFRHFLDGFLDRVEYVELERDGVPEESRELERDDVLYDPLPEDSSLPWSSERVMASLMAAPRIWPNACASC